MASIRPLYDPSSRRPEERDRRGGALRAGMPLAAAFGAALLVGALAQACTFDWDAYDPALASSSAGSGAGGSGSGGGAASTSTGSSSSGSSDSSSSASGAGGATVSSSSGAGGAGGAGSGVGGAGGGTGGGPTGPCGGMSLLTEDFADGAQGPPWYWSGDPATTIAEVNGEGVVTLPSNNPQSQYVAFQAKRLYDLRNDAVSVEVKKVANVATTAKTFLTIAYDDKNYLELAQQNNGLVSLSTVNGATQVHSSIVYNAVTHRFWRVREDGVATNWETSPDGVNWMPRAQVLTASLFDLSSVRADIGAFTEGGEINPGDARFDNVNGGGVSAATWCPSHKLMDDFGDGTPGRAWIRSYEGPNCFHAETGGELVVTPPINGTDYCAYVSSSSYDMTGSSVTIAVPQMVNTMTTTDAFVRLEAEGFGWLEIGQSGNYLDFRKQAGGMETTLVSILYNPTDHAWWRFREQGGTTYWEYSADGLNWKVGAQDPNSVPVKALDVILGAGTYEAVANPGELHFDNLNLPP